MAKFFIDRPIVAIVIAILTVIAGVVAMTKLPIAHVAGYRPPASQRHLHLHRRRCAHD